MARKDGREQIRRPKSDHAHTALLLHQEISALAIFLTLLIFLPLATRAGWGGKTTEARIHETGETLMAMVIHITWPRKSRKTQ